MTLNHFRINGYAHEIVSKVRIMQSVGELPPQITDFSRLHGHIDANVGWGEEIDNLPHVDWLSVTLVADALLRHDGI